MPTSRHPAAGLTPLRRLAAALTSVGRRLAPALARVGRRPAAAPGPVGGRLGRRRSPAGRRLALAGALAAVAALAAVVMLREPRAVDPLADLAFQDLAGAPATLADFRGKVVVLNLWATWCQPCREEMPSLGRLQAAFAGQPVVVLALSVDRAGPERVQSFLRETDVANLAVYRDPTASAARLLKVPGLPATILIDRDGGEAGRVLGIAAWDAPEAQAAVRALLEAPRG